MQFCDVLHLRSTSTLLNIKLRLFSFLRKEKKTREEIAVSWMLQVLMEVLMVPGRSHDHRLPYNLTNVQHQAILFCKASQRCHLCHAGGSWLVDEAGNHAARHTLQTSQLSPELPLSRRPPLCWRLPFLLIHKAAATRRPLQSLGRLPMQVHKYEP